MPIRKMKAGEIPVLTDIYVQAVEQTAGPYYKPEQIASWKAFGADPEKLAAEIDEGLVLVYEEDGKAVAFGKLHPGNYINLLYTHPDYSRRGFASQLIDAMELAARADGQQELHTAASDLSKDLFEKHGFKLIEIEIVDYEDSSFHRAKMLKTLTNCCED